MIYPPHHTFRPKTVHTLGFRGWLGSGVKDCTGDEILEGDIVTVNGKRHVVEFRDGNFYVGNSYLLSQFSLDSSGLEVIGHIAEVS